MISNWKSKSPFGKIFKILLLFFFIIIIPILSIKIWYSKALGPISDQKIEATFVIKKGEDILSISKRLDEKNLINSSSAFRIHLKLSGLDKDIQAGTFKLSPSWSSQKIATTLTEGKIDKWITIVEGLRKEEIVEQLSSEFDINPKKFLTLASEGKLFPDTYLIPIDAAEAKIISILENNFNDKFNKKLKNQAKSQGLSENEALILASIVEREGRSDAERPVIAAILLNRLKAGMLLGADATVQYALGYSSDEKTWWRKNITSNDLLLNSPYNTRKNIGLPPGPISNPGLSSIRAVSQPKESSYYYYLHDKDGKIYYAQTLQQHEENIANYLN